MYKLLLVAYDGNFVTDCHSQTKEEVLEKASNIGSKWYFYPFNVLIKDNGTISTKQKVLNDGGSYGIKGKTIKTFIDNVKKGLYRF